MDAETVASEWKDQPTGAINDILGYLLALSDVGHEFDSDGL